VKLFVPNCKTEMILTAAWTFRLFDEDRNNTYIRTSLGVHFSTYEEWLAQQGGPIPHGRAARWTRYRTYSDEVAGRFQTVTLPIGTIMRVSRVYIRQTTSETYDSLTFTIKKRNKKSGHTIHGRFWAKLADVNNIEYDVYLGKDHETVPASERASRIQLLFED